MVLGSHPMHTPWHCITKNELQELRNGMLVYVPSLLLSLVLGLSCSNYSLLTGLVPKEEH